MAVWEFEKATRQALRNRLGSASDLGIVWEKTRAAIEIDLLLTNSESGTMQRSLNLTSKTIRRSIVLLALLAPIAAVGSAWAQQQAAPDAAAPAAAPAAPAA